MTVLGKQVFISYKSEGFQKKIEISCTQTVKCGYQERSFKKAIQKSIKQMM